jgi:hypothetical protein
MVIEIGPGPFRFIPGDPSDVPIQGNRRRWLGQAVVLFGHRNLKGLDVKSRVHASFTLSEVTKGIPLDPTKKVNLRACPRPGFHSIALGHIANGACKTFAGNVEVYTWVEGLKVCLGLPLGNPPCVDRVFA